MPHLITADRYATDPLVLAQDGLATVHQLRDIGCASYVVANRCRPGGPWQRVLPRVVLLAAPTPPTPRQRLRAALLYAGPDALLTGQAALTLYGEAITAPEEVDVLVPHPVHPRSHAYVRIHRTHRPTPRVPVQGLPCAPLARALEDA
ncbi:hypothetical protein I3F58_12965 [Streptomyces sp. MUM 203J]|uniref:hypothetical protein n=1 Tax=Streptomyces sp. MUM 203J TaxID=2791990 RepID=UPI001F034648|nr:hypothetical protein [Streptomyces sp. MUM 203J]MCH0540465.1 hypothetical protein [Streptomyces sp. MUM 203J]